MKNTFNFLALLLLLTIIGCGQQSNKTMMEMSNLDNAAPTSQQKESEVSDENVVVERKLIKEGRVDFETNDLNATRKSIVDAVAKYKAYISSDQEFKTPGRKSNTIVIRVPADNFDHLLNDATKGVEKFESKEINVKDVTEEFLDVEARVKTKKELEARYIELLKLAKNVSEVLEIEKEIGQLRSEIESIEGRLNYLKSKISFSTLTMTFYESVAIENDSHFGKEFNKSFTNGSYGVIWFIVALANLWPLIVIGLGVIFGIRFYRRRKAGK